MKKKILILLVLFVSLIILGGFFWFQNSRFVVYKDEINKISFRYPKMWTVSSNKGFLTLIKDPTLEQGTRLIVTVDPVEFFVEVRGLTKQAETMSFGDKTFRIVHRKEGEQTFTHLYWQDSSGRDYLFEISPWQKNGFDRDVLKTLKAFKPL